MRRLPPRAAPGTLLGLALGLAAAWALGCGPGGDADRPSLVLVTVDTLRADRLGLYGYSRPTSPNIDALGDESVVFTNAITTCPSTAPATASILTGVHHATHAVHENGARLPDHVSTLAEILREAGYSTAAVVTNPVVGSASKGFRQGFDAFAMPRPVEAPVPGTGRVLRRADQVVDQALRWLEGHEEGPLFLWLHLMDPHGPYAPPEAHARQHADVFPADAYENGDLRLPVSESNYGLGHVPRYQAVPGRVRLGAFLAAYDTEIHYADAQIGRLVEALRARGLWDGGVFALTADHGESLGEHDYYFQHGWFTYDDSIRVPLLLHAPGLAPRRVEASVSLVDLAPTLLSLLGVDAAEQMEGRSLLPVIEGAEGDRPAFARNSYSNQLTALRLGTRSYVFTPPPDERARARDDGWRAHWPETMREELYDLARDPGERHDLTDTRPEEARALRERVRRWLADQEARARDRAPVDIDPRLAEELRALGYLE